MPSMTCQGAPGSPTWSKRPAALRAEQQRTAEASSPAEPAAARPHADPQPRRPVGYRDRASNHWAADAHHRRADARVARGGFGELEQAIMQVVWSTDHPVSGREVVDQLTRSRPVVYTTVLTVMDRLARKGILDKHPTGKAHTYRAVQSREAYTAQRMASLLGSGGDPTAVLLRFVEQFPPEHTAKLRAALQPQPGHTPRSEPE